MRTQTNGKHCEYTAGVNRTLHEARRSSFRDWAGNETGYPRELIETALAHVIGNQAEQAYRRSDALEKRRDLMEAWEGYCEPRRARNVVQIGIDTHP